MSGVELAHYPRACHEDWIRVELQSQENRLLAEEMSLLCVDYDEFWELVREAWMKTNYNTQEQAVK